MTFADRARGAATAPTANAVTVIVPLRSFTLGKARLAGAVAAERRADLARVLAERVVDASFATTASVAIVSNDADVRNFATSRGASVLDDAGSLDAAAEAGLEWATARGSARVVVAHADLPLVTSFAAVAFPAEGRAARIVACHRGDGTPVLSLPTGVAFRFAYGPGSFARHCESAQHAGLELEIVDDASLAFDIDLPEDLARVADLAPYRHTATTAR